MKVAQWSWPRTHQGALDDDPESGMDLQGNNAPRQACRAPRGGICHQGGSRRPRHGASSKDPESGLDRQGDDTPGKHVANPGEAAAIKEVAIEHDNLCHGMAPLCEGMAVSGTTAFHFAAKMEDVNPKDTWADAYSTFVPMLHDESTALATALAPEAAAQVYLTLDLEDKLFLVVKGLRQWVSTPPSRSSKKGHLVAFEGETLQGGKPPDLWRFEGDDDKLFKLASLAETVLSLVAQFYWIPGKNKDKWFDKARPDKAGLWISWIVPIPTGWAALFLFLDYPDLGTAFRCVTDLINSVAEEK
jgi:hypothetical protein